MTGLPAGLKAYLRVPFVMIVWVMETYTKNRDSFRAFMAKPRVSMAFKVMLALTALAWVIIGFSANEEQSGRLTNAMQGFWSDAQDLNAEKKRLDAQGADGGAAQ